MRTTLLGAAAIAKAGMPVDMFLNRFGDRLPKSTLKELMSNFERTKTGE